MHARSADLRLPNASKLFVLNFTFCSCTASSVSCFQFSGRKLYFSKTMSIALHGWSSAVSSLRINWQQRAAWHVFRPAALLSPLSLGLPSLQSLLELLPPIVWAVPKKKVSHSRKAMRDANKGLKDKTSEILQFTL